MRDLSKITPDHLRRRAVVYVRQSSSTQVEHHRESTARQYQLAERAVALGWPREQVKVKTLVSPAQGWPSVPVLPT